jgi:coenzyme Q-binding protein COQ10
MTYLARTLDLPYRPQDLFDLVSDVGRYPDFIKWIRRLRLLSDQEQDGVWRGRAEATVGFMAFTETFVTDIIARRPVSDPPLRSGGGAEAHGAEAEGVTPAQAWTIDVTLVRGPFRKLRNSWRFVPAGQGARVDFTIDFEFRNFVLQALAETNRDYAVGRIIESFTDEAARRYARVPTSSS